MKVTLGGTAGIWPVMEIHLPEFIVGVACRGPVADTHHGTAEAMIFSLPRPARHPHVLHHPDCPEHPEQGFLTSHGRFVDRKEGYRIAYSALQLLNHRPYTGQDLFSEDLW